MDQTPSWLLAISIISTAVVSIFGVVVPIWQENARAKREHIKREEEQRRAEFAELDSTAGALLNLFSFFAAPTMRELDSAFANSGIASNTTQARSVLVSRFYTWESQVWKELSVTDKQRVKALRQKIEAIQVPYGWGSDNPNPFAAEISSIVEEVLSLTRRATERE